MAKSKLQDWVGNLRNKKMPVLGAVIAEINTIADSNESSASELAEVILRDPNLTSHVLRVANSVQYNYSSQSINTISRAIVLIGLKGMRAICISLMILDRLLGSKPKERVLALVAQGFHAATQAQSLLSSEDTSDSEEVFIAGLLFNLGEMAFWISEDINSETGELLSHDPRARKAAMESIIGGSFKSLTRELAKHWQLGDTVQEALYPSARPSAKARAVIAGERISRAALFGWDSPQVKKVVEEVSQLLNISESAALERVRSSADRAANVAVSYGVAEVCQLIPSSNKTGYFEERTQSSKILKPDPQLQLSILRELSAAERDHLDVNTIVQIVLEGMHRGVGLERVAIAFIKGHKVQAKYALGEGTEHWRDRFLFDIGPYSDNIFTYAIENGGAQWFTETKIDDQKTLFDDDIVRILGRRPSLVSVLSIGQRRAALFYADRSNFGGQLNKEQYESFLHFANQAQHSLGLLASVPNT